MSQEYLNKTQNQAKSLMYSRSPVDALFHDTINMLTQTHSEIGFNKAPIETLREMVCYLAVNGQKDDMQKYTDNAQKTLRNTLLPVPIQLIGLPWFRSKKGRAQSEFLKYVECVSDIQKTDENAAEPALSKFHHTATSIYERAAKNYKTMQHTQKQFVKPDNFVNIRHRY